MLGHFGACMDTLLSYFERKVKTGKINRKIMFGKKNKTLLFVFLDDYI
jgi:hypothetical protein